MAASVRIGPLRPSPALLRANGSLPSVRPEPALSPSNGPVEGRRSRCRPLVAGRALVVLLAALPALAAGATPLPAAAPPSLRAAAEALAEETGLPLEGRRTLRLAVEARAPALAAPVETAIAGALSARGFAVTPHRGRGDAEAAARADGQDWLLRVRAGLVPGRRELALVGELIPAWPSFFLQRQPEARALPPRIVQSRAPADPATLLLARESRPPGSAFASVRRIARVDGRVLALAAGEAEEPGRPVIVLATPEALLVLDPSGAPVARRDVDGARLRPVRGAAASWFQGILAISMAIGQVSAMPAKTRPAPTNAIVASNSYSSTNVTTSAYVQLIASTANAVRPIVATFCSPSLAMDIHSCVLLNSKSCGFTA